MGFRPMPDITSNLIRFEQGKEESYRIYADNIQAYLDRMYYSINIYPFWLNCELNNMVIILTTV